MDVLLLLIYLYVQSLSYYLLDTIHIGMTFFPPQIHPVRFYLHLTRQYLNCRCYNANFHILHSEQHNFSSYIHINVNPTLIRNRLVDC